MMHRRHRQIKKAEIMSNPLVLFGVSFMTPDGKDVFVDSKVMEEWKNIKYRDGLMALCTDWHKEDTAL